MKWQTEMPVCAGCLILITVPLRCYDSWYQGSALSAWIEHWPTVTYCQALGRTSCIENESSHVSFCLYTFWCSDRCKFATALFGVWSSTADLTTVLYFSSRAWLATSHLGSAGDLKPQRDCHKYWHLYFWHCIVVTYSESTVNILDPCGYSGFQIGLNNHGTRFLVPVKREREKKQIYFSYIPGQWWEMLFIRNKYTLVCWECFLHRTSIRIFWKLEQFLEIFQYLYQLYLERNFPLL
jgi:hypothetical protein